MVKPIAKQSTLKTSSLARRASKMMKEAALIEFFGLNNTPTYSLVDYVVAKVFEILEIEHALLESGKLTTFIELFC